MCTLICDGVCIQSYFNTKCIHAWPNNNRIWCMHLRQEVPEWVHALFWCKTVVRMITISLAGACVLYSTVDESSDELESGPTIAYVHDIVVFTLLFNLTTDQTQKNQTKPKCQFSFLVGGNFSYFISSGDSSPIDSIGFPASGKIRETFLLWKVREFCWGSKRVRKFCSDWGELNFKPDLRVRFSIRQVFQSENL